MFAFGFIVGLALGLGALVLYVLYSKKVVADLQSQLTKVATKV